MTQAEMILRMRSILNEIGVTSGFFSNDNSLYKYIDSGQNEVIDRLINLQMKMQKVKEFYDLESLKILLSSKTFNLVSGTDTYTFSGMSLTDYKMHYDLQVDLNNGGTKYGATYKGLGEIKWQERNYVTIPTVKNPAYTVDTSSQIIVSPAPSANATNGGVFRYYKVPSAVTSSQDLTLKSETHEAILFFACSLAFDQDRNLQAAQIYKNKFDQRISEIV